MNISIAEKLSISARVSALAVAALLGLSLGLSGCKGDAGPAGTNAAIQQPTGTVQGRILDTVTKQPIVGALVDIGVATAYTNADGQFVMTNVVVPVDANNGNVSTSIATGYRVTVNLKGVTSPVNMADATITKRYPDFSYKDIPVTFTSLYTLSASGVVAPTPATGLVANVDVTVGKLAATITGVVADNVTKQAVAAGYTVKLVAVNGSDNSATGTGGTGGVSNIVGSATTDASGNFTFANIESLRNFRIDAFNADQSMKGFVAVTAPADGETKILSVQNNTAVMVASIDVLAPIVSSATPENNADIAITGGASVVYTFSEPIKQTVDTGSSTTPPTASVTTGLYNTVAVNYNGAKASNISHSLSWNAAMTQLTVTIPTLAAASKYSVSLAGTGTTLQDANNQTVTNIATVGKGVINFTTNGSVSPAAPTIAATNAAGQNYSVGAGSVSFDWAPVSGAKAYNVYRADNYPNAAGQYTLTAASPVVLSETTNALPTSTFVVNQTKVTYSYVVRSVSADNVESADSNVVTISDVVVPTATIPAGVAATYAITFSEPVDEVTAETAANYVVTQNAAATVPTVTSAVLGTNLTTVTLTLSATTAVLNTLTISNVTDISGNVMTSVARTF